MVDYNKKILKYELKYRNLINMLQNNQHGGDNDSISFESSYNGTIYANRSRNSLPSTVIFSKSSGIQSGYNINNIQRIYYDYMYPIFLILQYVDPERILMVGLGGGYIPLFFREVCENCVFDIVEIDDMVVKAAKHIGFTENFNTNLYIDDGINFITNCKTKYDCVIIDLDSEKSLEIILSSMLLNSGKSLLNTPGYFIINSISFEDNFSDKLLNYFPNVAVYYTKQVVYICSNLQNDNKLITPITKENISNNLKKFKYIDGYIKKINSYTVEYRSKN